MGDAAVIISEVVYREISSPIVNMKVACLAVIMAALCMQVRVDAQKLCKNTLKGVLKHLAYIRQPNIVCKQTSLPTKDPIEEKDFPDTMKFKAEITCKDGKVQKCDFSGFIYETKSIVDLHVQCDGSIGKFILNELVIG